MPARQGFEEAWVEWMGWQVQVVWCSSCRRRASIGGRFFWLASRLAPASSGWLALRGMICYFHGMTDAPNQAAFDHGDRPGKTRTWWHPLLTRLMDHVLARAYTVQDEVLVGKLPLRVDILLIRREDGELSEASRRTCRCWFRSSTGSL